MNRLLLAALAAASLSGCATLEGKLDNRVACSVARDKAFVVSEYGPVGIASTIAERDRAVICGPLAPTAR